MTSQKNPNVLGELIKFRIRALNRGHWVEAIVLAHMFVETQLRLILRGSLGKTGKRLSEEKIKKSKYVMDLANLALDNKFIDKVTYNLIQDFNKMRVKAVHNLSEGDISYEDLESPAKEAEKVISNLQSHYITVYLGPEMIND